MEIKKCPFCGGEAEVDTIGDYAGCFGLAGIYCKKCRIFFTCYETEWQDGEDNILEEEKNALLKAWNRRVDDGREVSRND